MNCQTIPTRKGGLFGAPAGKVASALPLPARRGHHRSLYREERRSCTALIGVDHELDLVGRVCLSTVEVILLVCRVSDSIGVDVVDKPGLERCASNRVNAGMRRVKHLVGERAWCGNRRRAGGEPRERRSGSAT